MGNVAVILACLINTSVWLTETIYLLGDIFLPAGLTWWDRMVDVGRSYLFLGNETSSQLLDAFAGIVAAVGYFWSRLFYAFIDSISLMKTIIIWFPNKGFADNLSTKSSCTDDTTRLTIVSKIASKYEEIVWSETQKRFDAMMDLLDMFNLMFGRSGCFMVLETILYYCIRFSSFFFQDGLSSNTYWISRFIIVYYFLISLTLFRLSANVCQQVCPN